MIEFIYSIIIIYCFVCYVVVGLALWIIIFEKNKINKASDLVSYLIVGLFAPITVPASLIFFRKK